MFCKMRTWIPPTLGGFILCICTTLLAQQPVDAPVQVETQAIKSEKKRAIKEAAQQFEKILESEDTSSSQLLDLEERFYLSRHQPLYFAVGNPDSKAQLSFKHRIVKKQPIYFGYSQIIFWDLGGDSKPFKDATYNPEFFYTHNFHQDYGILRSIDFGFWEHNSNGKDGAASRSFNRSYIRANFELEYEKWILRFSTKLGYIYSLDRTNKDIQDNISPLELKISLVELFRGVLDKSEFHIRFFPGGKYADRFDKGGFELGLSFRLGGLDLIPAFYMQYFNGFAESLINYDERVNEFRAGFIF